MQTEHISDRVKLIRVNESHKWYVVVDGAVWHVTWNRVRARFLANKEAREYTREKADTQPVAGG